MVLVVVAGKIHRRRKTTSYITPVVLWEYYPAIFFSSSFVFLSLPWIHQKQYRYVPDAHSLTYQITHFRSFDFNKILYPTG